MADPGMRELLARLDAQGAELAALRARIEAHDGHGAPARRVPARRAARPRLFATAALALLVALIPLGLLAANPFTDIAGSPHAADIDLIYTAGITTGCSPTEYCPTAPVTREQMASFLARVAGLGANPPVANAKTAQTAATATEAQNASTVGGYAPGGLLRAAYGKGPEVPSSVELGSTFKPIASVTIQAPGRGLILVSGAASLSGDASGCPRRADLHLSDAENDVESPILFANLGPTAGAVYQLPVSPVWVFQTSRGGTLTYHLEGKRAAGNGPLKAYNSAIVALFIPFGADGNPPAAQP